MSMWLFGSGLHKQHLLWLHEFLFTFLEFLLPILRSSEKEINVLGFYNRMTFSFLGWQPPLSPGLFPMGYFLLTSLPYLISILHMTLTCHWKLKRMHIHMVVKPTCIQLTYQEYRSLKNNRAIKVNPKGLQIAIVFYMSLLGTMLLCYKYYKIYFLKWV